MSALDEIWLPQNAIQCFDIVHCDPAGGFPNHAAMAFGRGRFFVPTYINPKFMTDGDWQVCAGLLKWARRNQDVLQNTTVLTSRVELGEPYAYAHWSGTRGIIAVRNRPTTPENSQLVWPRPELQKSSQMRSVIRNTPIGEE